MKWGDDSWRRGDPIDALLGREWLLTNGLGGYASGTLAGVCTRRYHGYLVAALPAPHGRVLMCSHLDERLSVGGQTLRLTGDERTGAPLELPAVEALAAVTLERGLPCWRYEAAGVVLERRVVMLHGRNLVIVEWRVVAAPAPVTLTARPSFQIRLHESDVSAPPLKYPVAVDGARCDVDPTGRFAVRLLAAGAGRWHSDAREQSRSVHYRVEARRGYNCDGPLGSAVQLTATLGVGDWAALVITAEDWAALGRFDVRAAVAGERARRDQLVRAARVDARLALAADAFLIRPPRGDADSRSVIAGYHWFTEWGRDALIALPGLTLPTGRSDDARRLLTTLAQAARDGLVPARFGEGAHEAVYASADATLWLFVALQRYLDATDDRVTLRQLLPTLVGLIEQHARGTRFGIGVDGDGLLRQGAPGHPLTWMDAQVGDWVVTPRRGKPVELEALWYNALRALGGWLDEEGRPGAAALLAAADRARAAFHARFVRAGGCLYDVVDGEGGDDPALRPNQLLALSLPHPILDEAYWPSLLDAVAAQLVTPRGLRTLAPVERGYQPRYDGNLLARDAAYHQGTVWAWLAGPFADGWRRAGRDEAAVSAIVDGLGSVFGQACLGQLGEVFDAEPPHPARGCVAQAWSVGELIRVVAGAAPP